MNTMRLMKPLTGLLLLLMLAGLTGCENKLSDARFEETEDLQIMDYIDTREDLSVYRELVEYTGQRNLLKTAGTYTVFIPDNAAFERLFARLSEGGSTVDAISDKEPAYWLNYFRYHLLDRKVNTNAFTPGPLPAATALDGKYVIADIRDSYAAIRLNNAATIVQYNIELTNGYVNIIDDVLMPPVTTVYEQLKATGKYETMLGIFEETGLDAYLKDSLVTVFIESDKVLEAYNFTRDSIKDLHDWASYHIIPDSGYFLNQLTKQRYFPLYKEESLSFQEDEFGQYYMNEDYRFDQSAEYGIDRVGYNGIYHSMDTIISIVEAPPSTIRMNLYPPGSPYGEQNVFAKAPARIVLNTGTKSYHQNREGKIVQFDAQQIGDSFHLTFSEVPAGKYRIRLIHRGGGTRGTYLTIYNNQIVDDEIVLRDPDGTFEEWNYLRYNYCGDITVESRSDVTITFAFQNFGSNKKPSYCCDVLMDMIELIPITEE
ncbi:MAG TPA: fasciclin domain-containing protein [Anseongella sp.]